MCVQTSAHERATLTKSQAGRARPIACHADTWRHRPQGASDQTVLSAGLLTGFHRFEQIEDNVADLTGALDELKARLDSLVAAYSPAADVNPADVSVNSDTTGAVPAIWAVPGFGFHRGGISKLPASSAYLTVPHRVLLWPCVRILLAASGLEAASDLAHISQQGTQWFIRREIAKHPRSFPSELRPPRQESLARQLDHGTFFPETMTKQIMDYTQAYFRTFNVLLPVLDYRTFVHVTLPRLTQEGYGYGDLDAVVALLVFALGQLATEGIFGEPIAVYDSGIASGIRGGDLAGPPGLYLFNEARRRAGFVDALCTLENVQIYLLQASYYEASSHHLEFWKSITAASSTIHALLKSQPFDWSTGMGDMISRAYWACLFQEDLYHLDLDLPPSGIQKYEDEVPLPSFHSLPTPTTSDSQEEEERSYFKHHFLAMIALRRLIVSLHVTIHESTLCATTKRSTH